MARFNKAFVLLFYGERWVRCWGLAKDHSLEEVCRRLGPIDPVIQRMIEEKERKEKERIIREKGLAIPEKVYAYVLEVGCGYGVAMHQLKAIATFREKIRIGGMNLKPHHGDSAFACAAALDDGLISSSDIEYLERNNMLPVYVHGDAGEKLPLPDDRVDFAYSICAVPFFNDKMHFLQELNRVLHDDGLARIDFRTRDEELGEEGVFLEIFGSDRKLIPFEEFIRAYPSLRLTRSPKGFQYLEMRKAETLDFGLKLVGVKDLAGSKPELWGVKSTYRFKEDSYPIDVTVE
jgi:SAM-dependent methyltransferase